MSCWFFCLGTSAWIRLHGNFRLESVASKPSLGKCHVGNVGLDFSFDNFHLWIFALELSLGNNRVERSFG